MNRPITVLVAGIATIGLAACSQPTASQDLEQAVRDACTASFFSLESTGKGAVLQDDDLDFVKFDGANSGAVIGEVADLGGDMYVASPGWMYCSATMDGDGAHVDAIEVSDRIINR